MDKTRMLRPADLLENITLGTGWKVIGKIPRNKTSDEVQYSICYEVEKSGQKAFLKAVDLHEASKVGDYFKEIERISSRVNKEKRIAKLCSDFRMKNVVRFIEADTYQTGESDDTIVQFIIYEKAKNDGGHGINKFGKGITNADIGYRLTLIHNITNALRTMHARDVVHQDVKPENVLYFMKDGKSIFKIGDFDAALQKSNLTLDEELESQDNNYLGSFRFAPLELLYGYISTDWNVVRKGADFYLLGSLICYYFTGRSLTELYKEKLQWCICWEQDSTRGKYFDYIQNIKDAFELCIEDISVSTSMDVKLQEDICLIVRKLCNPIPENRGEKISINKEEYKLTLIPTLSKLGNLMSKYRIK